MAHDRLDPEKQPPDLPEEVREPNRTGAPSTSLVVGMAVVLVLMIGMATAITLAG